MRIIDCAQGSPEWFAARLGIATASCFATILSKGKATKNGGHEEATGRRNLRTKLVLERMTKRQGASFESFATRQGTEREPDARLAFEIATGLLVEQVGFCRHDTLEAGCSPDGLMGDDGLEIKSPEPPAHLETLRTKRLPTQYVAQVQGNLWITGRKRWRYASFNPDFPERLQLVRITVERDQPYIDRLAAEVEVFMDEVRAEQAELEGLP